MSSIRSSSIRAPAWRAVMKAVIGIALLGAAIAVSAAGLDAEEPEPEPAFEATALAALGDTATSFALVRTQALRPDRLSIEGRIEPLIGLRPQVVQGGVSTTRIDVSNRLWLGWGRAAFGLGFGAQSPRIDQPLGFNEAPPLQPTRPTVSVGWRYDFTPTSRFYAGATAVRAWGNEGDLPRYNAKAGIEWKSARSRVGFDGARIALQLDSGYRMSIRTRKGGVQVALRRTF